MRSFDYFPPNATSRNTLYRNFFTTLSHRKYQFSQTEPMAIDVYKSLQSTGLNSNFRQRNRMKPRRLNYPILSANGGDLSTSALLHLLFSFFNYTSFERKSSSQHILGYGPLEIKRSTPERYLLHNGNSAYPCRQLSSTRKQPSESGFRETERR